MTGVVVTMTFQFSMVWLSKSLYSIQVGIISQLQIVVALHIVGVTLAILGCNRIKFKYLTSVEFMLKNSSLYPILKDKLKSPSSVLYFTKQCVSLIARVLDDEELVRLFFENRKEEISKFDIITECVVENNLFALELFLSDPMFKVTAYSFDTAVSVGNIKALELLTKYNQHGEGFIKELVFQNACLSDNRNEMVRYLLKNSSRFNLDIKSLAKKCNTQDKPHVSAAIWLEPDLLSTFHELDYINTEETNLVYNYSFHPFHPFYKNKDLVPYFRVYIENDEKSGDNRTNLFKDIKNWESLGENELKLEFLNQISLGGIDNKNPDYLNNIKIMYFAEYHRDDYEAISTLVDTVKDIFKTKKYGLIFLLRNSIFSLNINLFRKLLKMKIDEKLLSFDFVFPPHTDETVKLMFYQVILNTFFKKLKKIKYLVFDFLKEFVPHSFNFEERYFKRFETILRESYNPKKQLQREQPSGSDNNGNQKVNFSIQDIKSCIDKYKVGFKLFEHKVRDLNISLDTTIISNSLQFHQLFALEHIKTISSEPLDMSMYVQVVIVLSLLCGFSLGVYQKIIEFNYETNTLTSGVPNAVATDSTASDAAYMVPGSGQTGNKYAIAHKVVYVNPDYYSHDNYRSESSTLNVPESRFVNGNVRRYEFSVLLKDWTLWTPDNPDITATNLFQTKITGPSYVPIMVRVIRNTIRSRNPDESISDLVPDITPFINKWLHFRIDVTWSRTNTGNLKYYVKLPSDTDYKIIKEYSNIKTYTGDGNDYGYIKWGNNVYYWNICHYLPTSVCPTVNTNDIPLVSCIQTSDRDYNTGVLTTGKFQPLPNHPSTYQVDGLQLIYNSQGLSCHTGNPRTTQINLLCSDGPTTISSVGEISTCVTQIKILTPYACKLNINNPSIKIKN
eukprot:gene6188-7705_t